MESVSLHMQFIVDAIDDNWLVLTIIYCLTINWTQLEIFKVWLHRLIRAFIKQAYQLQRLRNCYVVREAYILLWGFYTACVIIHLFAVEVQLFSIVLGYIYFGMNFTR